MELKAAFFCDGANISREGKVNILGIFSAIASNNFPAVHPHMIFAIMLNGHRSEVGQHSMKINFIDEDGREIIPAFHGTFEILPDNLESNFILNLANIQFKKPGLYAADIVIDNHNMKSVNLKVLQQQIV